MPIDFAGLCGQMFCRQSLQRRLHKVQGQVEIIMRVEPARLLIQRVICIAE